MDVPDLEEDDRLASEEAIVGYKPQGAGKIRVYCFSCAGAGGELFREFQVPPQRPNLEPNSDDHAAKTTISCTTGRCCRGPLRVAPSQ